MAKGTFTCIDAHTCGNPVRVVKEGAPELNGATMMERRLHFLEEYDWMRKGLMREPRGHDLMCGTMLFSPTDSANDIGFLYLNVKEATPMCGHGAIGTVTVILEHNIIQPKTPGMLRIETPAGLVTAHYHQEDGKVKWVRITNVPSYLDQTGLTVEVPKLGEITVDIAYGGNVYAIVDPQPNFQDMNQLSVKELIEYGQMIRNQLNEKYTFQHPEKPEINRFTHVLWTGEPTQPEATARNAVLYGERAIDRSPCGTGTSARIAQWAAKGKLNVGDKFIHESIIGSMFTGCVEEATTVGNKPAIIPSITGWAKVTGLNTITIDEEDDPFAQGFMVT